MSYMSTKAVIRSIRLEPEVDRRIEQLAADLGLTVSAYIRQTLEDAAERADRRRRLERALTIAARLPSTGLDRDEMWGVGTRVPG